MSDTVQGGEWGPRCFFFLLKVEQQVAKVFLFLSLGMMLMKIMTLVAVRTQEAALKYWFALI